jgi:hypothetical protein
MHKRKQYTLIEFRFGSTQNTRRANKAIHYFYMGRPMAPQIGPGAIRAGSKARSGPAQSHPEPAQIVVERWSKSERSNQSTIFPSLLPSSSLRRLILSPSLSPSPRRRRPSLPPRGRPPPLKLPSSISVIGYSYLHALLLMRGLSGGAPAAFSFTGAGGRSVPIHVFPFSKTDVRWRWPSP